MWCAAVVIKISNSIHLFFTNAELKGNPSILFDIKKPNDEINGTSLSLAFINVTSSSDYVMKVIDEG